MDLASVVAALASVGVRVSGSTPNNNVQGDSSRACPTGLASPEPSGTLNDPGQHFQMNLLLSFVCCTSSQGPFKRSQGTVSATGKMSLIYALDILMKSCRV